ncbi:unnamed protein product [Thelazia callipaeda]|uniref:Transmembrane protein n=1 Tax=Thelazia callipaeda TaxID=103827 RepID=A0A0N5DBB0_THECL|nr:unnamed protein product [Thelazia callipaeda]
MGITFGDYHLEQLYQQSLLVHTRAHLLHVQCLWITYFLLMALAHLLEFDFMLIISAISATLCLVLQAALLIKPMLIRYVLFGTVQVLALSAITLLPTGHSALLPIALVIFTIYALIPMKLTSAAIICCALSVLQLVALIFLAQIPFTVSQVRFSSYYRIK